MYRVTITDKFPGCPGRLVREFPTHKECQWYAEREIAAAAELFTDGAANLSYAIEKIFPATSL